MAPVEERAACALLKQRFEAAGFTIEENRAFEEDGIRFEIDGFDARHRVGYEYVTSEAGDSWDVDDGVIAALADRRRRGDLHVLVVAETEVPDAEMLGSAVDRFLSELREQGIPANPAGEAPPAPADHETDAGEAPVAAGTPADAAPLPILVPEEPAVIADDESPPATPALDPPRADEEPPPVKAKTARPKSPRAKAPATRPKATRKKPARK